MAVSGIVPAVGDLVWLDPRVCANVDPPMWFRVIEVRPSSQPGWVYLGGWQVFEPYGHGPETMMFVPVTRLVVHRDRPDDGARG